MLDKLNKEMRQRVPHLRTLHTGVSVAQYVLAALVLYVISQVLMLQQYNTITIYIAYFISYGIWIVILVFLAKVFFSWYATSAKNIMILILALSMIAYVVNGVAGLINYTDMLNQQKKVVKNDDVAYFPEFSIETVGTRIGMVDQIASAAAYILTWIGTVRMLYPYIKKFGKVKFWIIMGVSMVYYLISYPLFILGYFTPSVGIDAMTSILIFSMAGILSGIIFGADFFISSQNIKER